METIKLFANKGLETNSPQYDGVISDFKNADIYSVKFTGDGKTFTFKKGDVILSYIPYAKGGNAVVQQGTKIKFKPLKDIYFKVNEAGVTKQIDKAEADAISLKNTANTLDEAAAKVKAAELTKNDTTNKFGVIVVGAVLFASLIGIIYAVTRKKVAA